MSNIDQQQTEDSISTQETCDEKVVFEGRYFLRRHGRKVAIGFALLIFIGIPLIFASIRFIEKLQLEPTVFYFLELLSKYALLTAGIFWFFFFGATLGSFLNLVAWRLPRSRTLIGSSYCPSCDAKLKLRENFPLFGWLLLGGSCSTCAVPIPARYFLVELVAALLIGALALIELVGTGINLVKPDITWVFSFDSFVSNPQSELIGYFLLHTCLICILMTVALINQQKQSIPRSIFLFAFTISIVSAIVWPLALPYSHTHQEVGTVLSPFASLLPMIIGIGTGGILGFLFVRFIVRKKGPLDVSFILLLALIGSYLGWQATLMALLLTALLTLLGKLFTKNLAPTDLLWLGVSITIFTWRFWIEGLQNLPI